MTALYPITFLDYASYDVQCADDRCMCVGAGAGLMSIPVRRKAELLVEETRHRIEGQRAIVGDLERRGVDATQARKHLAMLEETLMRRIEILNQLRAKSEKKH
jgi:hypothetical protein